MIEIRYADINDTKFISTLKKIGDQPLPVKTAFTVKRILDKIGEELKVASKEYRQILQDNAELEEDGTVKKYEDLMQGFKIKEECRDKFMTDFSTWLNKSFQVDQMKLTIEQLGEAELSAGDLNVAEAIFDI